MKAFLVAASLFAMAVVAPAMADNQTEAGAHMIHHDIYITLKDANPAAIDRQLDIGRKYLSNHPGEISFSASVLAQGLTRHQQVSYLINETNFSVAFHLVFKDAASHNVYQTSDDHVKHFIPLSSPNWTAIRVFDSEVVQ